MKWNDIDITSPEAVLGSLALIIGVIGVLTGSFALGLIGIVVGAVLLGMTLMKPSDSSDGPPSPAGHQERRAPAQAREERPAVNDGPATSQSLGTVPKRSP